MGGEVIGINTETFDGNEDAIKEAAAVLDSQGAKYRNISVDSDSSIGKYASDIMAFPTTILVDRMVILSESLCLEGSTIRLTTTLS